MQIETSKDFTFDEDANFIISRQIHINEVPNEDPEAPRVSEIGIDDDVTPEEYVPEDHDMLEIQRLADPPQKIITNKIRPTWDLDIIQDVEIVWCSILIIKINQENMTIF